MVERIVVRVYGLIVNDKNEVLLSDEYMLDTLMTKFPGGGLEFGEGTIDCLKREAIEEFGQELKITEHFYTTDFYQKALFYNDAQLISVYYFAEFTESPKFKISETAFDFAENINGSQSFRWKSIEELKEEDVTYPIDRVVVRLLKLRIIK
jgi:8-oxo-dGTP diphosphatase